MGEPAEVRQKRQGDHMDDPRVCGFRLCFQHSPEWVYIRFDKYAGQAKAAANRRPLVAGADSCSGRLCIPDYRNFFQKEKR